MEHYSVEFFLIQLTIRETELIVRIRSYFVVNLKVPLIQNGDENGGC